MTSTVPAMKISFTFWPPSIRISLPGASHQARSCTGKVRYGHLETARKAAANQATIRRLDSYPCRYCGGWHLYTVG